MLKTISLQSLDGEAGAQSCQPQPLPTSEKPYPCRAPQLLFPIREWGQTSTRERKDGGSEDANREVTSRPSLSMHPLVNGAEVDAAPADPCFPHARCHAPQKRLAWLYLCFPWATVVISILTLALLHRTCAVLLPSFPASPSPDCISSQGFAFPSSTMAKQCYPPPPLQGQLRGKGRTPTAEVKMPTTTSSPLRQAAAPQPLPLLPGISGHFIRDKTQTTQRSACK